MRFPWYSHDIPMIFPWYSRDIPMILLLKPHKKQQKLNHTRVAIHPSAYDSKDLVVALSIFVKVHQDGAAVLRLALNQRKEGLFEHFLMEAEMGLGDMINMEMWYTIAIIIDKNIITIIRTTIITILMILIATMDNNESNDNSINNNSVHIPYILHIAYI